jgi:hypothetical protein
MPDHQDPLTYTVVVKGRQGYEKLLASSPYADVVRYVAVAVAERGIPHPDPRHHHVGESSIEVREDGKPIGRIVLRQSERLEWRWEDI